MCSPIMASAIKGIRTRDERMELKVFVNSKDPRKALDKTGADMHNGFGLKCDLV